MGQSIASHDREARDCPLHVLQVVKYKADQQSHMEEWVIQCYVNSSTNWGQGCFSVRTVISTEDNINELFLVSEGIECRCKIQEPCHEMQKEFEVQRGTITINPTQPNKPWKLFK